MGMSCCHVLEVAALTTASYQAPYRREVFGSLPDYSDIPGLKKNQPTVEIGFFHCGFMCFAE